MNPIRHKKLEEITPQDLQALIDGEVAEGRDLDFKREVPGNSDGARKEFLADVCSFANCVGGDILFGVDEDGDGVAAALVGLPGENSDEAILRLESMIRTGISPRLATVATRAVSLDQRGPLLILRIGRSWNHPHAVWFKETSKFYSRTSRGKYQMDVDEIRSAVVQSSVLGDRLRNIRDRRLELIRHGESPIALRQGPTGVLQIIPFSSLEPGASMALPSPAAFNVEPIGASGWNNRINFDGLLTYSCAPGDEGAGTYAQLFRNGSLEAVENVILRGHSDPKSRYFRCIPSQHWEDSLVTGVEAYLGKLIALGVVPPFAVMYSMLGVKGWTMTTDASRGTPGAIDRDQLIVPEVVIESIDDDYRPWIAIRPIVDMVWNACGFHGSPNYGDLGEWRGRS